MTKKEWEEHCKWLDTFRGKTTITSYDKTGNKKTKKNS